MEEEQEEEQSIEVETLSLEEWLQLLKNPPKNKIFNDFMFPTDAHRDEYLATIGSRPLSDIKWLIGKLLPPGKPLGDDIAFRRSLPLLLKEEPQLITQLNDLYIDRRRLAWAKTGKLDPRESIYWVIDLIDEAPKEALQVLDAYILLYGLRLPDGRVNALFDCMEIIRARCLAVSVPDEIFDDLSPRDMEHLVERLYAEMGYETFLTPYSKDGGYDVIAHKNDRGQKTKILIDVKHYHQKVGVELARQIAGVVSQERASKGVLVTTGKVTRDARKLEQQDPRIELIDHNDFCTLMNQHCGRNWVNKIDRLISESKLAMQGQQNAKAD